MFQKTVAINNIIDTIGNIYISGNHYEKNTSLPSGHFYHFTWH